MSDDVDALFGGRTPPRPTFTERLARGQFLPPQENSPPAAAERSMVEPAADDGTYKPYGFLPANTFGESCEVRGWMNGTLITTGTSFPWRIYLGLDFHSDTELRILLPSRIIVIEGKHLDDLRHKLSRGMVTFIQQHHPRIWPSVSEHEPLIARIEVMRPESSGKRENL